MRSLKPQRSVTRPEINRPMGATALKLSLPKNIDRILPPESLTSTSIPYVKDSNASKAISRAFYQTSRIHVDKMASSPDLSTSPSPNRCLERGLPTTANVIPSFESPHWLRRSKIPGQVGPLRHTSPAKRLLL